jgi:hypothetical protein
MHNHGHKHIDKKQANETQKPTVKERTEWFSAFGHIQHVLLRMMISVDASFRPLKAPPAAVQ